MKKLILMVALAVVMVGCGGEVAEATVPATEVKEEAPAVPEKVTLDEITGYWLGEGGELYEITESGIVIAYAEVTNEDGSSAGRWALPMGSIACGEEVTMTLAVGDVSMIVKCEFAEDRNTAVFTAPDETLNMKRISSEQAAELGVE